MIVDPPTNPPTEPPTTDSPTSMPTVGCIVVTELTCTEELTNLDCDDIPQIDELFCQCTQCSTSVTFIYTADSCADLVTGAENTCIGGTTNQGSAEITVTYNGRELYSEVVAKGDSFTVTDGNNCLPSAEAFEIEIAPPGGGNPDQTVTLTTRCDEAGGVALGDKIGAVDFVGYTCSDSSEGESCLSNVLLESCARNTGSIPLEITDFSITFTGDGSTVVRDVTPTGTDGTINAPPPVVTVCREETFPIYKCRDQTYFANTLVVAEDQFNIGCEDPDDLSFDVGSNTRQPTGAFY